MQQEKFWVAAYDIADKRRLRRVARLMEQFGTRVQESVFECWLDDHARRSLDESLAKVLKSPPDNVRFYPLCADCRKTALEGGTNIAENVSFYIV